MQTTRELEIVCSAVVNTPIRDDRKARLITISGIDSSGKGYIASKVAQLLVLKGKRVAAIGIDGWLNLPKVRFSKADPGRHFYENAFRFGEMFSELIDPLVSYGSVDCVADYTEETAREYRKHRYKYDDVDTVLMEGIFLLRRDLRDRYNLKVWVECGFETALSRAIVRGQEGLPAGEAIAAYQTIYFPAQMVHFAEDNPRAAADLIFENDNPLKEDL